MKKMKSKKGCMSDGMPSKTKPKDGLKMPNVGKVTKRPKSK